MQTPESRRVLVIAYYFPPLGLSGVQRTLKFVKYLPQFGWKPTVLTVDPIGYVAHDESLLEDLTSRDVRIARTAAAGPGKLFAKKEVKLPSERTRKFLSRVSDTLFIPDNKIGWKHQAVAKGMELHGETPFDLLFATAPPFTDFLIGQVLKKYTSLPLVFDYRDPWIEYPFKFYPTPLHKWRNIVLERRALRASSHVVTTNRRVKELLIQRHQFLTHHDIDIIPQGFDPEDFASLTKPAKREPGKMRITYAGIFWEDRVPDYFLQALHDVFIEREDIRGNIEARFIGHFRDENMDRVRELQLEEAVIVAGYLSHRACVQELIDSDVLWMIVGDDLGSPGKVYEYIGAGKPILGCVPDGFLKTTILEAGGVVVAPKDVHGIKQAIIELYDKFQKRKLEYPSKDVIDRYNRIQLTGNLVKLFESLMDH
ncbi:MAG TPA: glycosyltransferase [Bacteroidota bacterium]